MPPETAVPVARPTVLIHNEPLMNGTLVVHTTWLDSRVVSEVFTFACLADVLGLPESVVESRYSRLGLAHLAVLTPNEFGRKVRAFPMERRDEVLGILGDGRTARRTPHAGAPSAIHDPVGPLDVVFWRGDMYLTVRALAVCFDVTVQTIRSRMKACGLWPEFVSLVRAMPGTGRPPMGLPVALAGDAMVAMRHSPAGGRAAWTVLLRTAVEDGTTRKAQEVMEAAMNIAPLDATRADPERGRPAPGLDALCEEINRALA